MGSGFSKMKKQARHMQQQIDKMREDLQNTQVVGASSQELVKVTIDGEKKLKSIQIKPECVSNSDVEGLQDLIYAAFQDAYTKLDAQTGGSQSGASFPSMPFGF